MNLALYLGVLMGLVKSGSFSVQNAFLSAVFMFFHGFAVFSLNDYFDHEIDKNSDEEYLKGVVGIDSRRELLLYIGTVSVLSVIIIGYLLPGNVFLPALGIGFFAVFYSAPPIRLKARPFLDSLSNGFWILCLFSIGLGMDSPGLNIPIKAYWMATFLAQGHAVASLPDIDADRKQGIRTTGMVLGWRKTLGIEIVLILLSLYFLNWSIITLGLLVAFLGYLGYIFVYPDNEHFYKGLKYMMPVATVYGVVWLLSTII